MAITVISYPLKSAILLIFKSYSNHLEINSVNVVSLLGNWSCFLSTKTLRFVSSGLKSDVNSQKKVHKLQRDGHTAISQWANSKLFDRLQYWKVFPSHSGKSNKCTSVTFTWQYHPLWGCMQCLLPTSQEETKCLNCNFVRQYFTFIWNIWRTWCRDNITSTTSWPELTLQAIIATLRKLKRLWKKH